MLRRLACVVLGLVAALGFLSLADAPSAHAQGEETITIQAQDVQKDGTKTRLAGVTAFVYDSDGAEVGVGTTGDDGRAVVLLPGPGVYIVRLETATLPDERQPLAGSRTELTVTVNPGANSFANFTTGEKAGSGIGLGTRIGQRALDGIRLGLVIAICSVGLSLIFGTTGLTNFAHGELVTFGGMAAFVLNVSGFTFLGWLPFVDDRGRMHLLVAAPIVVALGAGAGWFLDWGLWSRLRKRGIGLVSQLVVSVGLSIFLRYLFLLRFEGRTRPLRDYANQRNIELFAGIGITKRDLTTAIVSLVVLLAVAIGLQKTRLGKATRAVSDNVDLASSTGIDSQRVIRLVWMMGAALAALGGIIRGLDEQVGFEMGSGLLFLMFAGITLGGLGSAYGALVGGFIIGLLVEMSTLVDIGGFRIPSELKNVPPLFVLVLVLLLRPQGILGRKERVG